MNVMHISIYILYPLVNTGKMKYANDGNDGNYMSSLLFPKHQKPSLCQNFTSIYNMFPLLQVTYYRE
eukprot:UN19903